jgi:endonuclease-8
MPEGDTIFRAARTLHRALAGKTIVRFESAFPALNRIDDDQPLIGRTVESVSSRGKHLLMMVSGDLVLRTHMRMNGSWHIYRPGERWRRPARDMRVLVASVDIIAVGFNIPVAEFIPRASLTRHPLLGTLGPDLAADDFDPSEVLRRLRERADVPIGDALLDQRAVAGIGNVLKSEVLYVSGVDPFVAVRQLSDEAIARIVDESRRLMKVNVLERTATLSPAMGRRTTGSLDPFRKLWVYGRGGRPCRKCGTPISSRHSGSDARLTYWCAVCQKTAG